MKKSDKEINKVSIYNKNDVKSMMILTYVCFPYDVLKSL